MTWKVARYNSLREEVNTLRARYRELQTVNRQKNEQLATLQLFASEVHAAYSLDAKSNAPTHGSGTSLMPSYRESVEEFNLLQNASYSTILHQYPLQWQRNIEPSIWPVNGRLLSPFGVRTDPFSGEGTAHTGVDISCPMGTPISVTADGVVSYAGWMSGYGRLLIVEHDNGMRTYYAHLSAFTVMRGQDVRRGQEIGRSGASGRATAPHLHYEVRMGSAPVNPYKYLSHSPLELASVKPKDLSLF